MTDKGPKHTHGEEEQPVQLLSKCNNIEKCEGIIRNRAFRILGLESYNHYIEDILQDVHSECLDHRHKLKFENAFPSWLGKITERVCVKWIRGKMKREILSKDLQDCEPSVTKSILEQLVSQEEKKLFIKWLFTEGEEIERKILILHRFCEMSYSEIARELGKPGATVRAIARRTEARIAGYFKKHTIS